MNIKRISWNDNISDYKNQIDSWNEESKTIAMKAINGSKTSILVVAEKDGELLGIANYRIQDREIKRINTATKHPRSGVGKKIISFIIKKNSPMPMWTYSQKSANGWCDRLGMRPVEILEDGRIKYWWSAEDAKNFSKEY